jgi:predicted nucleic-acid-binding protein
MKAVDTSVLARFFVNDPDDSQAVRQRPAAAALMSGRVFVPVTVLLEFEWVMRGFYGLPRRDIVNVLQALVGIEHVTVEDRATILVAIDAFEAGLDFADALHLARSSRCSALVTFDRQLARRAKTLAQQPVVELLA